MYEGMQKKCKKGKKITKTNKQTKTCTTDTILPGMGATEQAGLWLSRQSRLTVLNKKNLPANYVKLKKVVMQTKM